LTGNPVLTIKPKSRKRGRPLITKILKLLIRDMKIDNYLWGCKRIQDELEKISIDISREAIRNIIPDYRKSGEINRKHQIDASLSDIFTFRI